MIMSSSNWQARINNAGITYCPPDWIFQSRVFIDYDLWVVLDGQGTLDTPRGTYDLGSGDCFILRVGESYVGRHDPQNPLTVAHLHFDFYDREGRVCELLDDRLPIFQVRMENLTFFSTLLHRAVEAWLSGETVAQEQAHQWLQTALLEVERQNSSTVYTGLELAQYRRVNEICETITRAPGKTHQVAELAKNSFYSPDHFSRIFKRFKGLTPRAFIINTRVEAAKSLLLTSSLSISRIAEILGYNDVYFFSRQFREKTSRSPSAYRQQG